MNLKASLQGILSPLIVTVTVSYANALTITNSYTIPNPTQGPPTTTYTNAAAAASSSVTLEVTGYQLDISDSPTEWVTLSLGNGAWTRTWGSDYDQGDTWTSPNNNYAGEINFSDTELFSASFFNSLLSSGNLYATLSWGAQVNTPVNLSPDTFTWVLTYTALSSVPVTLAPGTPGYLFMNQPSTDWQGVVWQSSPLSPRVLWADGCDANFIGEGANYTVSLSSPVTVRDMSLHGGNLSLLSAEKTITLTDPRDGISTIAVDTGSNLTLQTPVHATGGLLTGGGGQLSFNRPLTVNGAMAILGGTTLINDSAEVHGGVAVYNGSLLVNGVLDGNVANHGLLGGSGTIHGTVVNHGTISPGSSTGTLTIDGAYTHGNGATYLAELSGNGRSDLLNIHGKATLHGGYVKTALPKRLYSDGYAWTILRASEGVYGAFAGISGQPYSNTLSLGLAYNPGEVNLQVHRLSYASFADNKGAQAVGRGLDSIVPLAIGKGDAMEDLLIAMDFDYSAQEIASALSALNPEMYPTLLAGQQHAALGFATAIARRETFTREQRTGNRQETAELEARWMAWGQAQGSAVTVDKSDEYNGYDFTSAGVVVGIDREVAPSVRLGFATAVDRTEFDWRYGTDGDQNNLLLGAYAKAGKEKYFCDVQTSVGFFNNDTEREVSFTGYASEEETDFSGRSYLARFGGGYIIKFDAFALSPVAALTFLHLSTNSFHEQRENGYSMHFDDASEDAVLTYLGIQSVAEIELFGKNAVARAEIGWQHDFHGDEYTMAAWFDNYPSFAITGPSLDEDMLLIATETQIALTEKMNAYADLGGSIGNDTSEYTLSIGLQWVF